MEFATIFIIAVLVISIIIHEVAHGYMANWLGDPTARLAGRLTLNPISHIDPIGSVLIPAVLFLTHTPLLFGWAKPVPYNPYNLNPKRRGFPASSGDALVAAAGPGVNILIALIFSGVIRLVAVHGDPSPFIVIANYIVHINVLLACFNLIPIPPLDGSKILGAFLPMRAEIKYRELLGRIEQYGFTATLAFIFVFMYVFMTPFSMFVETVVSVLTGI
jgi:Zn-dependent protease